MLWKITLLFYCALYYANGKSLLNDYPRNVEQLVQESDQDENFDEILPNFMNDQTIDEDAAQVQDEEENESMSDDYDGDSNVVKNTKNLKVGYFPSHKRNNEKYNDIIQKKAQVHRLPLELKNLISQFPRNDIKPSFSKILNQDKKESQASTNDDAEFQQEEPNFASIDQNDDILAKYHDELELIKTDQQGNNAYEPESPNQFQEIFQQFSNMVPNFKPDQIFNPKINPNFKIPKSQNTDAKVGLGQFGFNFAKLKVASLTEYMKKAITNAQAQLKKIGPSIPAHNPPLVINEIPNCPIFLTLKKVEGAHSIAPYGESKGIYYNKMYAFTQYKFKQLKYYYDVEIKPFNLFAINQKMDIVLTEPPAKMQVSIEKEKKMNLLHFEFVNPKVSVTFDTNTLVNLALNYIINNSHPVVKNKVTEIVSRDSKLMLEDFVKKAN